MYKFSKKLSLAALTLTLTTNLAQAIGSAREITDSYKSSVPGHAGGGQGGTAPEHEAHTVISGHLQSDEARVERGRTSYNSRVWIHESHKRGLYNQWAGDLEVRGDYNAGSFRKFKDQLGRLTSEYGTLAFTRPIDESFTDRGQSVFAYEGVSVYYNLPRKLYWTVNREGRLLEMHRLQQKELERLVRDLLRDKDLRAIKDLLITLRYLTLQSQRKVCDHISRKLDESDVHSYFSPAQLSRIRDCLRRLERADELERNKIYNEIDDICRGRGR